MTKDKLIVILKKLGEMPTNSQVNSYDVYHWIQDILNNGIEEGLTEEQKNCPYCHMPHKPLISTGIEPANSLGDSSYYETVSNIIGEGPNTETAIGMVNVLHVPYCPMCGRLLNEEKE